MVSKKFREFQMAAKGAASFGGNQISACTGANDPAHNEIQK